MTCRPLSYEAMDFRLSRARTCSDVVVFWGNLTLWLRVPSLPGARSSINWFIEVSYILKHGYLFYSFHCINLATNAWRLDSGLSGNEMKWNESGFRPPLCTYRLNWARRTSWGWWDDWDDTVLQTQDSKFEPWRSEAEHATSRSRRLPTILTFTRGWGRNNFVSFKPPRPGTEPRTLAWKVAVLTTTLGPPPWSEWKRA